MFSIKRRVILPYLLMTCGAVAAVLAMPPARAQEPAAPFASSLRLPPEMQTDMERLKKSLVEPDLAGEEPLEEDPLRPRLLDLEPFAAPSVPNQALRPVALADYPVFSDDLDKDSMRKAIQQNSIYLSYLNDSQKIYFGSREITVTHLKKTLKSFSQLLDLDAKELDRRLRRDYEVFESVGSDGAGKVVYTGYFEPEIEGALASDEASPVPVYGRPADLVATNPTPAFPYDYGRRVAGGLAPHSTRAEIDKGSLSGSAAALAWARDPADLFFVQLQGSGRLKLPGGQILRLVFDSANGHPYRSISRYLAAKGLIPPSWDSLSVMSYVRSLPEAIKYEVLHYNARYVFFALDRGVDGPYGSIGVPLTPGRSIAVSREMPRGCLAFIQTRRPVADPAGNITGSADMGRFALTQDAGFAINNPGRVDVFWGSGGRAAAEASRMKEGGKLYFLLLKGS